MSAIVLRLLIGAVASLGGFAGFGAVFPGPPPAAPAAPVDAGRSTQLLLAIDLAVLAAKDCVTAPSHEVAREFDLGLRRIQQLVAELERTDEAGRRAARRVEGDLLRIEALVRTESGTRAGRAAEIAERRTGIESALTALHEADTQAIEAADGATRLTYRLGGAGLATLGLCFAGGIGLARLCVV